MPIGEALAEIVIRPIFELIFYGVAYWIGYLVLSILSLGQLKLAPLMSIDQKKGKIDWSIWLHRPMQGRVLKAEVVCLSGLLFLAGTACVFYFVTRDTDQSEKSKLDDTSPPLKLKSPPLMNEGGPWVKREIGMIRKARRALS